MHKNNTSNFTTVKFMVQSCKEKNFFRILLFIENSITSFILKLMIKGYHKREATLEVLEKENIGFERYSKLFCESEIFYSDYGNFFFFNFIMHLTYFLALN